MILCHALFMAALIGGAMAPMMQLIEIAGNILRTLADGQA
jgi:hypothetical protein